MTISVYFVNTGDALDLENSSHISESSIASEGVHLAVKYG